VLRSRRIRSRVRAALHGAVIGVFALSLALTAHAEAQAPGAPDTVIVHSGELQLRAQLYRPEGHGPFPAVLFNHGSGHTGGVSAAGPDHRHPELLGPLFAKHGYVFLYLYRRGDGLSAGQGVPAGDLMDKAASGGQDARNKVQLQLLEGDELNDAAAGLAYLRKIPEVDSGRLVVAGHSFGGSLTILLAERDPSVRAIVTLGSTGYSWDRSPELRARLISAVDRMSAVPFFVHAQNDYSLAGQSLGAEMERLGKPHRVKIYPPIGRTADEGHDFVHLGIAMWEPDVFEFLDQTLSQPGQMR
jgi:carboxymethylenebutenolidase